MTRIMTFLAMPLLTLFVSHHCNAKADSENCFQTIKIESGITKTISGIKTILPSDFTCIALTNTLKKDIQIKLVYQEKKLYMTSLGVADQKTELHFIGRKDSYEVSIFPLFREVNHIKFSVSVTAR